MHPGKALQSSIYLLSVHHRPHVPPVRYRWREQDREVDSLVTRTRREHIEDIQSFIILCLRELKRRLESRHAKSEKGKSERETEDEEEEEEGSSGGIAADGKERVEERERARVVRGNFLSPSERRRVWPEDRDPREAWNIPWCRRDLLSGMRERRPDRYAEAGECQRRGV